MHIYIYAYYSFCWFYVFHQKPKIQRGESREKWQLHNSLVADDRGVRAENICSTNDKKKTPERLCNPGAVY